MPDEEFGTAPEVETQETGPEPTSQEQPPTGGDNPAWQSYRDALPEMNFESIKPLLAEQDKQINRKFEEIHSQYAPLKGYQELGVPVERVQQIVPLMDMLDNDPVQFFELLKQHPAIAATLQDVVQSQDDAPEGDEQLGDPFDVTKSPEFQQMQERLSGFETMFQEQQRQQQAAAIDQEVDSDITKFREARPDYSDQDMQYLFNSIATQYQNTGKMLSFEQAAAAHDAYREQILSAPRPGASAPRVMPTNGGAPSPNSAPRLGQLNKQESVNLLAELTRRANSEG